MSAVRIPGADGVGKGRGGKEGRGKEADRVGLMQGVRVWKGKLGKERGPNRMQ